MTPSELSADVVARTAEILKGTVGDFSEQDMLARPVPGANHAAWQIGHLVGALQNMFATSVPGVVPDSFATYAEKFTGKTAHINDPAHYGTRAQLLEAFAQAHSAVVAWAKDLSTDEANRPLEGRIVGFAPTVGHLVQMTAVHIAMHLGQIQVIRRSLGKPLLF